MQVGTEAPGAVLFSRVNRGRAAWRSGGRMSRWEGEEGANTGSR